jgi:hypothetical protein
MANFLPDDFSQICNDSFQTRLWILWLTEDMLAFCSNLFMILFQVDLFWKIRVTGLYFPEFKFAFYFVQETPSEENQTCIKQYLTSNYQPCCDPCNLNFRKAKPWDNKYH